MESYVVHLQARSQSRIPVSNGYCLYASLCTFTRETPLDDFFHPSTEGRKSFSLSPILRGDFEAERGEKDLVFAPGGEAVFRIAFVHNHEGRAFASMLEHIRGKTIRIGNAGTFTVLNTALPGEHPLAISTNQEDLIFGETPDVVGFNFVSPAGFKRKGKQYFLPLPELIYGDLLRKWRLFFDPNAWPDLECLLPDLEYVHYRVESRAVRLCKDRILRGFEGNVEFANFSKKNEKARRALVALGGLAFFTGVGYKTTQGMGQVLPFFGG